MNGVKTVRHAAEIIAHRSPAFNPFEFDGFRKQAGLTHLNQIDIQQMNLLTDDGRSPQLPEGKKGK